MKMGRIESIEKLVVLLLLVTGQKVSAWKLLPKTQVSAAKKFKSLLVFGDSTVDPGNNDNLNTTMKANFKPYGIHFINGRPTGRHSDGRLVTDFIAQYLGISMFIPAYLDPQLPEKRLRHGVSFASAGSGHDNLTNAALNVLSFPKQIELFKEYKTKLNSSIGSYKTARNMKHSLVIISTGSNDIIWNYFGSTAVLRSRKNITVEEYCDLLITRLSNSIEEIHKNGPKAFVVSELPPIGCLPIVRKLFGRGGCYAAFNAAALFYNSKLLIAASELKHKLGISITISGTYAITYEAITNPEKFGFTVAEKGCCGSGFVEFGETCKGQKLCNSPLSYLFFDAVHLSERMYKIMANKVAFDLNWEQH